MRESSPPVLFWRAARSPGRRYNSAVALSFMSLRRSWPCSQMSRSREVPRRCRPRVCHGQELTFKGTRVPVRTVLVYLAKGETIERDVDRMDTIDARSCRGSDAAGRRCTGGKNTDTEKKGCPSASSSWTISLNIARCRAATPGAGTRLNSCATCAHRRARPGRARPRHPAHVETTDLHHH